MHFAFKFHLFVHRPVFSSFWKLCNNILDAFVRFYYLYSIICHFLKLTIHPGYTEFLVLLRKSSETNVTIVHLNGIEI